MRATNNAMALLNNRCYDTTIYKTIRKYFTGEVCELDTSIQGGRILIRSVTPPSVQVGILGSLTKPKPNEIQINRGGKKIPFTMEDIVDCADITCMKSLTYHCL